MNTFTDYPGGVTVERSAASPTGYEAVFVYVEKESYTTKDGMQICTAEHPVQSVVLYSDCMMLFDGEGGTEGTISGKDALMPDQYRPGLYPAGGTPDTTYSAEMEKLGEGRWGVRVPLSSGAFVYNFRLTFEGIEEPLGRQDDPSNPTMVNSATGIRSLSSLVYVPYDPEKTGHGAWADRSVEVPCPDTPKGTVETVSYTGADGTQHGLAVYLPAGYDPERAEPYPVLYISHGTSGDVYGDELRWMNEGCVPVISDNLNAAGKAVPAVVVAMNNQQYSRGPGHQGPFWDYALVEEDQLQYIMPYVEAHYHVSHKPEDTAYAGLSMGGYMTSDMLLYHADRFGYYGIWSYADANGLENAESRQRIADNTADIHVMLEAGKWDFGLEPVRAFGRGLDGLGVPHLDLVVPAGHDWENWQMVYAYAAENFFFKS